MFISHSLRNFRCTKCFALLCKQDMKEGALECKCHNCNTYSTLIIETDGVIHENKPYKSIKEDEICQIKTGKQPLPKRNLLKKVRQSQKTSK